MFIILYLTQLLHLSVASPTTLTLEWIDTATYPKAICNDGTGAAFYYAEPPTDSNKDDNNNYRHWLIHLMGGAWCYSIETCQERWTSTPQLMSNKYWSNTIDKTGIFDNNLTNNPLANAYKIYIPYCSSDGWMGNKDASNETGMWYLYGQNIIESVFNTLINDNKYPFYKNNTNNNVSDIVWFSGCSAGARGAMVNLDYIPDIIEKALKTSKKDNNNILVYGILDSAIWMNIAPFDINTQALSLANETKLNYYFMNGTGRVYNSKCYDIYITNNNNNGNQLWKCILGQYRMGLLNLPHFINNAQYDAYSLSYDLSNNDNINTYTTDEYNYAEIPFKSTFREIILTNKYGNFDSNIFASACFHHCTSEENLFWNITINGQSFASTLKIFIDNMVNNLTYGDSMNSINSRNVVDNNVNNKWVDNCTDNYINCGNGCASADTPF